MTMARTASPTGKTQLLPALRKLAPDGGGITLCCGGCEWAGETDKAGAGGAWLICPAMISLAAAVPSAPHTGQMTWFASRPLRGSASNAYFCPQLHKILMVIMVKDETKAAWRRARRLKSHQRLLCFIAKLRNLSEVLPGKVILPQLKLQ